MCITNCVSVADVIIDVAWGRATSQPLKCIHRGHLDVLHASARNLDLLSKAINIEFLSNLASNAFALGLSRPGTNFHSSCEFDNDN
ncbi:unnamed protein product [Pieris brassicae]|uniref:Uncharacterized protein n=1 Tax=Pieris brassicae TaxID=7116 RepID=A0A9P0TTU5_PIEBR|nr:unnamed protein product [Pieris brassicae]